mmetsp:Transcript_21917/g.16261  ORF Transcript_21917/g.16261 Transcript_21917/m.16261 type:complete len:88 (+) Transcript_21917:646-909(+)
MQILLVTILLCFPLMLYIRPYIVAAHMKKDLMEKMNAQPSELEELLTKKGVGHELEEEALRAEVNLKDIEKEHKKEVKVPFVDIFIF